MNGSNLSSKSRFCLNVIFFMFSPLSFNFKVLLTL
nr:MAG TPA: hypothetical protein [Caudoviricetes sp.]DAU30101.1 MAG TPA: hypothetical protein [Caudoviricetes sp.]DAW61230.1 MAG TPA: hypothetical protein [Caudoviricetes sp.]DAX50062.1 MAG TPA: hypothetical protein [Caudoviricetes sp.]